MTNPHPRKVVRCAVYARKSSEEGLGQEFNSLDAQRASAEAYILSQKAEGWVCLPQRYEDGGYSGGNLERPALKRLMADIEARLIDCVVVYKIDRLSRSLLDFARLIEAFQARNTAFVSVTQQFNTDQSMGRLIMNVLLSFAQFERELASERTRDKIALSRQRGQWTGGRPVLGYDIGPGSKLTVNDAEADVVRGLYEKYLATRSINQVLAWSDEQGITTKSWTSADGKPMGRCRFTKSGMWRLLTNPVYVGQIPHGKKVYPGQHRPIVAHAAFRRVQELLAENGRSGHAIVGERCSGLLKGLLRCGCCGGPMTHSTTSKGALRYRYYSCAERQTRGKAACVGGRVPAGEIEQFVVDKIKPLVATPEMATRVLDLVRASAADRLRDLEAQKALVESDRRAGDRAQRLAALDADIAAANEQFASRADVEAGLAAFDPVWACLSPAERAQLIGLIVERVEYDHRRGRIGMTLRNAPGNLKEAAA